MTTTDTRPLHWAATMYADECRAGKLSRREFLTRTTALGVTAATAYTLIGRSRAQGPAPEEASRTA